MPPSRTNHHTQTMLLAFPSSDALDLWRAHLTRCCSNASAPSTAGAGGNSADFCGWLLKAAPGWKTFQNRFIALDADKCSLRFFEGGPPPAILERLLGTAIPKGFDELKIPTASGAAAREAIFAVDPTKERGDISLVGASVSVSSTGDSTAPAFAVTNEEGRVFAFVATSPDAVALWVSAIGRLIAAGDRKRPVLATGTPYAGFLASMDERGSGYMNKADSAGSRWSYRFFVLRGSTMSYYTDHSRAELKGSFRIGPDSTVRVGHLATTKNAPTEWKLTLGAQPTADGAVVHKEEKKGGLFSGLLGGGGGKDKADKATRDHQLCLMSEQDLKAWLDMLSVLINAHAAAAGKAAFNAAAFNQLFSTYDSSGKAPQAAAGAPAPSMPVAASSSAAAPAHALAPPAFDALPPPPAFDSLPLPPPPPPELPEGWTATLSSNGQEYYTNKVTGTTQWDRPTAPADAGDDLPPPPPPPPM